MSLRAFAFSSILLLGATPGATARQVVAPRAALSEPSLSPDGREIAFVAGGDIWTVPAEGGVARLLVAHAATESRPVWSPDGRQLAFVSTRTGNGDIYVLDLTSGAVHRRTYDEGRDQLDAWSADGTWLYFSTSSGDIAGMNDIWRVPAAGGQPMPVAADRYASEYWAQPSPDGRTLAITARGTVAGQWWRNGHSHLDESEVWLVRNLDADAPGYARFDTTGGAKNAWPMWSADGRTLYFMSDRSGAENLWSRELGGGAARQLTRFTSGRLLWPQVSRDGRSIVFERDFGVWRFDVATGAATQVPVTLRGATSEIAAERQVLSQGFGALSLSPDGRKVAFVARGDVYVAGSRDGGDAVRLTHTATLEADPSWLPDSRRVVYAANRDTAWHLYVHDVVDGAVRALTNGAAINIAPRVSPDGRWVAYQRNGNELRVVGVDGRGDRKISDAFFGRPPFISPLSVAWSPDSRHLAFTRPEARGFSNAWVASVDGGRAQQVTFLADASAGNVQWSNDGTYLLHRTGQRTETPRIVRVDLVPRTPRFREDRFLGLFTTIPPRDTTVRRDTVRRDTVRRDTVSAAATGPARRAVVIDTNGIRQRSSIIDTRGLDIGAFALSPDDRTLVFSASAGGQQQLYTMSMDELAREPALPRPLTTSTGNKASPQWSADGRELWFLEGGRVTVVTVDNRQSRTVAVSAETHVDFEAEKRALFRQAWQYLADNFYDEQMHGTDWAAIARRVEPYVEGSRSPDDLRRVLSLMVGELNASHLGVSGPSGGVTIPVARLGVRFDRRAHERDGSFRVNEVIAGGPAAIAGIRVGDAVTALDGVPLARGVVLDSLLAGRAGRRVALSVRTGSAAPRTIALQPVSLGTEKGLVYRQWVEERRAYVARASNNRLGYVHMFDMGQGSLDQLYLDLDVENQGREGVVIDIRNNNGGFVNPYALDVFSRQGYLQFTSRGTRQATPGRGRLGQRALERPTVLVTNQHSLSDAEDFTEGYRALGLGKVVGEPTSGWIIFTSNVTLLDGSTSLRLPSTRITDAAGKDMELVPRPVDVRVVRPVGESYSGRDTQLDAAVRILLQGGSQAGPGR